jgi:hypothetical protein
MEDHLSTPVDTASAVLALSKATWRLGTSLSKLDHDAKPVDSALKNLAEDTKMWTCLATQVHESGQTVQDLELFVKSVRMEETEEEASLVYHPQHLVQLNKSRDQIEEMGDDVRRHTDNLRITLLLIQT